MDGIISQLDQFLATDHDLVKRYRMSIELDCEVSRLEDLLTGSQSDNPRTELLNRVNLNLLMCGSAPRARHLRADQKLAIINEEAQ